MTSDYYIPDQNEDMVNDHWKRCPAHEDNTGNEDRCMCQEIDDADRDDDGDMRRRMAKGD